MSPSWRRALTVMLVIASISGVGLVLGWLLGVRGNFVGATPATEFTVPDEWPADCTAVVLAVADAPDEYLVAMIPRDKADALNLVLGRNEWLDAPGPEWLPGPVAAQRLLPPLMRINLRTGVARQVPWVFWPEVRPTAPVPDDAFRVANDLHRSEDEATFTIRKRSVPVAGALVEHAEGLPYSDLVMLYSRGGPVEYSYPFLGGTHRSALGDRAVEFVDRKTLVRVGPVWRLRGSRLSERADNRAGRFTTPDERFRVEWLGAKMWVVENPRPKGPPPPRPPVVARFSNPPLEVEADRFVASPADIAEATRESTDPWDFEMEPALSIPSAGFPDHLNAGRLQCGDWNHQFTWAESQVIIIRPDLSVYFEPWQFAHPKQRFIQRLLDFGHFLTTPGVYVVIADCQGRTDDGRDFFARRFARFELCDRAACIVVPHDPNAWLHNRDQLLQGLATHVGVQAITEGTYRVRLVCDASWMPEHLEGSAVQRIAPVESRDHSADIYVTLPVPSEVVQSLPADATLTLRSIVLERLVRGEFVACHTVAGLNIPRPLPKRASTTARIAASPTNTVTLVRASDSDAAPITAVRLRLLVTVHLPGRYTCLVHVTDPCGKYADWARGYASLNATGVEEMLVDVPWRVFGQRGIAGAYQVKCSGVLGPDLYSDEAVNVPVVLTDPDTFADPRPFPDLNFNGLPDPCECRSRQVRDDNGNQLPDVYEYDTSRGITADLNGDGYVDGMDLVDYLVMYDQEAHWLAGSTKAPQDWKPAGSPAEFFEFWHRERARLIAGGRDDATLPHRPLGGTRVR